MCSVCLNSATRSIEVDFGDLRKGGCSFWRTVALGQLFIDTSNSWQINIASPVDQVLDGRIVQMLIIYKTL